MSNWGTAVQNVTERVHRYGSADPDIVKRALARAIKKYSSSDFFFNQATYDFSTTSGTFAYGEESSSGAADGYPSDMVKPVKLSLSVSNSWYEMKPFSIDEFRERFTSTSFRGYPQQWAWFSEKLNLYPIPNGTYTVRLDHTQDLGIPIPSYASSAWSYTWSTDGMTIQDSDTNDWFTEALDLVCASATYFIALQNTGNPTQAQLAKQEEMEQLEDMRIDSEASQISPDPRPFF